MSKRELNPHEQAQEELLKWEAQGIRHMFDPEYVVMADLYPSAIYGKEYWKHEEQIQ
jgi:hypothetical protein